MNPPVNLEAECHRFEVWMIKQHIATVASILRLGEGDSWPGQYADYRIQGMWAAWQEAVNPEK